LDPAHCDVKNKRWAHKANGGHMINEHAAASGNDPTQSQAERLGCTREQQDESTRDERKSADLAAANLVPERGSKVVRSFSFARELLRDPTVLQDGAGADQVDVGNPDHVPLFYLDGDAHKARRAAIMKFFTPNAVKKRHRPVMERATDELLTRLRATGRARLDEITFELAVAVVSEIVGLTESDQAERAQRIGTLLTLTFNRDRGLKAMLNKVRQVWHGYQFLAKDVRPAVRERKRQPREDVLSQVIEKGYSERAIVIECLTFATAGMVTTREFIVMVCWYMFDRPQLCQRFLAAGEDEQLLILQEILRLEPIAAMVFRRAGQDIETQAEGSVRAGSRYSIDLRAVNSDESAVGTCPFAVDPERAKKQNGNGTFMSFGDGAHRCPGWQVALHETRVFVDRLLRVPGIRLERAPDMLWNSMVLGYELRNAVITCDRAPPGG
jgi:cytochrome P450